MAEAATLIRQKQIFNFEVAEQQFKPRSAEASPLAIDDRCLMDVDQFNARRLPNGAHNPAVAQEMLKNYVSAVKEAAMPYSVNKVAHDYVATGEHDENGEALKSFMWLGAMAVESAASGLRFHKHPEARKRVMVEIAEARNAEKKLRQGTVQVFISPAMTRLEASYEDAKQEHLADDDSVRISYVETGPDGEVARRIVESALIRNVPLEAWVALLQDPNNIFGKTIAVKDDGRALSVMEVFEQLELPEGKLQEGLVSLFAEVARYIKNPDTRRDVETQVALFRGDQADMDAKAQNIAKRWMAFDQALADSLVTGYAAPEVVGFINSLQSKWGKKDKPVILAHQMENAQYLMTRELAKIVEKAKQNMLWTRAGIVSQNQAVLDQLEPEVAKSLYDAEMAIQQMGYHHEQVRALEAQTDRQIASRNVKGGGGCPGDTDPEFDTELYNLSSEKSLGNNFKFRSKNKVGKISWGKCVVKTCSSRPGETKVGGCGVCIVNPKGESCQSKFDRGHDPTKQAAPRRPATSKKVGKAAVQRSRGLSREVMAKPRGRDHASAL